MTPDQVRARTLALIEQQRTVGTGDPAGLTLGARNFDSLDAVELAMAIEEEFAVGLPDVGWGYDTTIEHVLSDAVRFVCRGPS